MPGTSGLLSPFGKIKGLYFNESREPDGYEFDIKQDLRNILKDEDVEYIEIEADNKEDYYRILDELDNFNRTSITVSGTSKNKYTVIIESEEDKDDDKEEKTTEV